jgi:hypothetical protein
MAGSRRFVHRNVLRRSRYFVVDFFTGGNSPYLPCFSLEVKWMPLAAYSGGGSVLSITKIC